MAMRTIEEEMLDLKMRYWQAMRDFDVDTAVRATDFPCVVAGASGAATVDEPMFRQMMTGAEWRLDSFHLDDDIQVRAVGDDVRIVAYKVHEELSVGGEPVTLDAADASVWTRREGTWRCALHTESLLGDAYGRDRFAPSRP